MAKTGRPRTFDREQAVEQALRLFWQHGYESTSLSQLKAGMGGISAPSFYAAFGSKSALFGVAVRRYLDTHGQVTECLWDDALPPRDAIEQALRRSAKMQCGNGHPRGCMVALGAMSAPSAEHRAVARPLAASRGRTRAGFARCVERGVSSGELDGRTGVAALALAFDSFLLGLSTLARDGVRHQAMQSAIDGVMACWDMARAR